LATQLVQRALAEIFVVQMGTVQAMGIDDPKLTCRAIMWSVFRTHDKMAEFENSNFEDHPAIALEHTKFLACNSLATDVASPKSETKEAAQKAAQAVCKADSATTTLAEQTHSSARSFVASKHK
jgi:hypothetical protein